MGMGEESTDPDFPGRASHVYSEMNGRAFYRRWLELLTREGTPSRAERPERGIRAVRRTGAA